jgi:hypothetical protein
VKLKVGLFGIMQKVEISPPRLAYLNYKEYCSSYARFYFGKGCKRAQLKEY